MASDSDKKKLTELRVIDLRAELENRGLDKNGVKAVLIERLQKVLKEEGHDPDEYVFDLSEKKPSKRISVGKRGDHDTESETHSNADENHDISLDAGENDDVDSSVNSIDDKKRVLDINISDEIEKSAEVKDSSETEKADIAAMQVKEEPKSPIKTEKEEMEVETCFAPSSKEMENAAIEKAASESNAVDNEDSINLTIGEEEEKLLAEEEDSSCHGKESKDASEVRGSGRASEAKSSESKADAASSGGADGVNSSGASAGGEGSGAANVKEEAEEGRVNRGHKESEDGAERSKDEEEKRQQTDGPSSSAPATSERADGSEGGEGGVGDEEGKSGVSRKEERAGEKGKRLVGCSVVAHDSYLRLLSSQWQHVCTVVVKGCLRMG